MHDVLFTLMILEIQIRLWIVDDVLVRFDSIVFILCDKYLGHLFLADCALVFTKFHFLTQYAVPTTVSVAAGTYCVMGNELCAYDTLFHFRGVNVAIILNFIFLIIIHISFVLIWRSFVNVSIFLFFVIVPILVAIFV